MDDHIKLRGGNGDVILDGALAIKKLRNTSKPSNIQRFIKEVRIVKELANEKSLNIVEIKEVNEDVDNPQNSSIIMKRYNGTIADLLDITRGNLHETLNLMLPIIETLRKLAYKDNPIYHRDIKPDNILYEKNQNKINLVLTDFGICYIDDNSNRLTPQEISMGPRFFMAPEYEIGRVENVTSSGDIFSIGKVIWWLLWGEKDQFMPSNFWHIKEYDLFEKYKTYDMQYANYIIASCLKTAPSQRSSYDELISKINQYNNNPVLSEDIKKQLKVQLYQEKRNKDLIEINHYNANIVNLFSKILIDAIEIEIKKYPQLEIMGRLFKEYKGKSKDGVNYTSKNVSDNSAHYLCSFHHDNIYCAIHYHPAGSKFKYAYISFDYTVSSKIRNEIKVFYSDKEELNYEYKGEIGIFNTKIIIKFIEDLIDILLES